MAALDEIVKTIIEFDWGNYGLDAMEELPSSDWAYALAVKIAEKLMEIKGETA